jgi:type IV secretion system protein VirD4
MKSGANDMLFKKIQQQPKQTEYTQFAPSSVLGRGLTSVSSAKNELFKSHIAYNPLDYISINSQFFGLEITNYQPFYFPFEDSTHMLYCGATRSAKTVALSHRAIEAIRKNIGIIIIDPKKDDYIGQVIKEELIRQNRVHDLLVASFPNNFGYSGFNNDDTHTDFANKLISALDLEPTNEPKSNYYRRNERTILKKIIYTFINCLELLNVHFEANYKSLANFIFYVYQDLVAKQNYNNELSKFKTNIDLLKQYSQRYFDIHLFDKLEFQPNNIDTIMGLYQTILELTDANIYTNINIDEALYNSKVIYIQADQLDEASLKMIKILQVDIVQKAKRKVANCIVIADEISFYATQVLSNSLSIIKGFGVQYLLAVQDLAQLNSNVKQPILSNCQTKYFYKSSDIETLEYLQKISGLELVTQTTKTGNETTIRQVQEELLNVTRLRALKRDRVAVIIAESLNTPIITQTWHIEVTSKFDWSKYDKYLYTMTVTKLAKEFVTKEFQETKKEAKQKNVLTEISTLTDGILSVTKFEI